MTAFLMGVGVGYLVIPVAVYALEWIWPGTEPFSPYGNQTNIPGAVSSSRGIVRQMK